CRQLRQQRHTQTIPIIFMTQKNDRVDRLQGLEMGVVDYVTKPFDSHELHLRIRNAILRAEQAANLNAVTELPEVPLLDQQLYKYNFGDHDWALLIFAFG